MLEQRLQTAFSFHHPEIIIKPSLGALRPQHLLQFVSPELGNHMLPWTTNIRNEGSSVPAEPIVGCTVAGGVLAVHRISASLYNVLLALQERLLHYGPTSPLLGSAKVFLSWYRQLSGQEKNTIHGDLIALYLRLSPEQQHQVIGLLHLECHTNITEAVMAFLNDINASGEGKTPDVTDLDVPTIAKIVCRLIHQLEKYT